MLFHDKFKLFTSLPGNVLTGHSRGLGREKDVDYFCCRD